MPNEHEEMMKLLRESVRLTKENNELLQKVHRFYVYSFWAKLLWFAFLIGVPVLLYFYVLAPYVKALGFNAEEFGITIKNFSEFFRAPWNGFRGE